MRYARDPGHARGSAQQSIKKGWKKWLYEQGAIGTEHTTIVVKMRSIHSVVLNTTTVPTPFALPRGGSTTASPTKISCSTQRTRFLQCYSYREKTGEWNSEPKYAVTSCESQTPAKDDLLTSQPVVDHVQSPADPLL